MLRFSSQRSRSEIRTWIRCRCCKSRCCVASVAVPRKASAKKRRSAMHSPPRCAALRRVYATLARLIEAARGVLVSVEDDKIRLLGAHGMSAQLEARLGAITLADEIPVVHALRKGEMVSVESAEEFRRLYAGAYDGFDELADMQTYLAT